ncbi:MAG TPA: N-acetyltransferase [Bradyrhizobium sp.]|uniref:GNAT family N-acetyltransferase n=1 Tax=Bradyrhizobium sp. TaxID=376 RepID=UPI002CC74E68|nr:N-acetyltransferase [Bradyrhizobium sp.]HLZ05417.1 N-acetyltransferase [Bradyrhizobium sp.]
MTAVRKTPVVLTSKAAPFAIRAERASDIVAREALLDTCFGEDRHMRTCQRLRDGRAPAEGLALSAVTRGAVVPNSKFALLAAGWERTSNSIRTTADLKSACGDSFGNSPDGACREGGGNCRNATRLVGTVRLWHVGAGGIPALLLGPLAVDSAYRKLGVGAALMDHALAAARARGHRAALLLGDAPYYTRFGFSADKTGELNLPGAFERERLLGLELVAGALDGAWGMIVPTGARLPKPKVARAKKSPRTAAAVA